MIQRHAARQQVASRLNRLKRKLIIATRSLDGFDLDQRDLTRWFRPLGSRLVVAIADDPASSHDLGAFDRLHRRTGWTMQKDRYQAARELGLWPAIHLTHRTIPVLHEAPC